MCVYLELVGVESRTNDSSFMCPCLTVGEDEANASERLQESLKKCRFPQRQAVLGGQNFLEDLHVSCHDEGIQTPPYNMPFTFKNTTKTSIAVWMDICMCATMHACMCATIHACMCMHVCPDIEGEKKTQRRGALYHIDR